MNLKVPIFQSQKFFDKEIYAIKHLPYLGTFL